MISSGIKTGHINLHLFVLFSVLGTKSLPLTMELRYFCRVVVDSIYTFACFCKSDDHREAADRLPFLYFIFISFIEQEERSDFIMVMIVVFMFDHAPDCD